jgi:lipoprotein-releasing system ATP-binding protein
MKPETSCETVLEAKCLARNFKEGGRTLEVLRDVSFELRRGERVAVVGRSGSGKSTLLHLLAGLDTPTAGSVWLAGQELSALEDRARSRLRNAALGFVYQFHHLLTEFDAIENVAMPLYIGGVGRAEANARATALLDEVGLIDRATHRPGQLSGGERQRVAIARALITRPDVVLADEPTGNLDDLNAGAIAELIARIGAEHSVAFVIVTHSRALAAMADRTLQLVGGTLGVVDGGNYP